MSYVTKEAVKAEFEKYGATEDFNAIIDSIPPADAMPVKRGTWKHIDKYTICCSECGDNPCIDSERHYDLTPFCPWCGAKMDII